MKKGTKLLEIDHLTRYATGEVIGAGTAELLIVY